jgi:hypothetical protein
MSDAKLAFAVLNSFVTAVSFSHTTKPLPSLLSDAD